ncbi:MAG: YncE family protein [bacterium]|nr:YncE family protein [bacterium]
MKKTAITRLLMATGQLSWILVFGAPNAASAYSPRMFAANPPTDEIVIIDINDAETYTVFLGSSPIAVVAHPNGSSVWATTTSGTITVIDLITNTISDEIFIGGQLKGIDFAPDGSKLFVVQTDTNSIIVLDPPSLANSRIELQTISIISEPTSIKVHPEGQKAYVLKRKKPGGAFSDEIDIIDTTNNIFIKSVTAGQLSSDIAFTSNGHFAVTSDAGFNCPTSGGYSILYAVTDVVVHIVDLGHGTAGVDISSDDMQAHFGVPCGPSRGILVVDVPAGTVVPPSPLIPELESIGAIKLTPDGSRAYVANRDTATDLASVLMVGLDTPQIEESIPLSVFRLS